MKTNKIISSINNVSAKRKFSMWLILLFLCPWLSCSAFAAAAPAKILIINSDESVNKYREVKAAFKSQITPYASRIIDFNLKDAQEPAVLEKLIKDESPDIIYSIGSLAYQLAAQYNGTKPLLFSSVINWERFGRRENNYGVANELSLSQEMSLLRYVLPGLSKIGVIYDPNFNTERIVEARKQTLELGLKLVELKLDSVDDLDKNLETLLSGVDVLWLIADPGVLADKATVEKIFASSAQLKKPIYTYSDAFVNYGASLVIAADTPTMGRQAANLAQSILLHESIKELVQTPAGSTITLNTCQLGKINAGYNEDALDSVNQLVGCH